MADTGDMQVMSEPISDGFIVRPVGDVDLSRSPTLRYEISRVQRQNPPRIIVDLQEVPYMDSSGVATLIEAMQTARRQGGKLVLCNVQPKVRAIFEITRLDSVFTIVQTCEEAQAA